MATFMQLVQSDVKSISVSNWKVTHTRIGFICTCYNTVALFLLIQKREEKKLNISLSTFTCAEKSEAHRWRERKKIIQEDAWKLHRNCNCAILLYICVQALYELDPKSIQHSSSLFMTMQLQQSNCITHMETFFTCRLCI